MIIFPLTSMTNIIAQMLSIGRQRLRRTPGIKIHLITMMMVVMMIRWWWFWEINLASQLNVWPTVSVRPPYIGCRD